MNAIDHIQRSPGLVVYEEQINYIADKFQQKPSLQIFKIYMGDIRLTVVQ